MTATLRKLAPTQVQLDIEVGPSEFDRARERAFRKLARQVRVPGFRPGHIPRRIIEQHVGPAYIDHETIEAIVPDAYAKALEEHALDPVDRPKIDLERIGDGRALKITATVAVKPEITLRPYAGIKVTKPAIRISDDDVEKSIEALRRRAATLEPVPDRGIAAGDIVTLDYVGRVDGELIEEGSKTNHTTEITPERLLPGFAEQLYGARAGEQRTVNVTFPSTYRPEQLANRAAVFAVTIHDVKTPVLPPDDEFVKQVSDLETLDALRAEVRTRLARSAEAQAREAVESQLLNSLVEMHDIPLPDVLVERETENLLTDLKQTVMSAGAQWSAYLRERNQTEDDFKTRLGADARRRVKGALLLEAIAKAENIKVSGPELDREIDALARSTSRTRHETFAALARAGGLARLRHALERNKTLALLVEKAEVVEEPKAEPPKDVVPGV